jgi:hypothetical protein
MRAPCLQLQRPWGTPVTFGAKARGEVFTPPCDSLSSADALHCPGWPELRSLAHKFPAGTSVFAGAGIWAAGVVSVFTISAWPRSLIATRAVITVPSPPITS